MVAPMLPTHMTLSLSAPPPSTDYLLYKHGIRDKMTDADETLQLFSFTACAISPLPLVALPVPCLGSHARHAHARRR